VHLVGVLYVCALNKIIRIIIITKKYNNERKFES
jgi:hypothetical protein